MSAAVMEKQRRKVSPEHDALEHIVDCRDKPFLEERYIDSNKGRGVFTLKAIKPSSFVVEYRGNIFPHKCPRPKRKCGDILNNYTFEFSWKGERWCIDASTEDGTLGRLVNDDHTRPNCEMRKIVCEGTPHLCLFAMKEISPGEEITYNYGNSSYPWRSKFEDSEADDDEPPDTKHHKNGNFTNIKNKSLPDSDSSEETFTPQASCSQQEEKAISSDELDSDRALRLQKARPKVKGPSYDRRNYCYVCGAGFAKISRHLRRHADEEPDIAEAFKLRKNSKERKKLLEKLRNRGNYKHNQEVLKHNCGQLKVRRRPPTMEVSAIEHVHCLYCKGLYQRKEIWRHAVRCSSRPMEMPATDGKTGALDEDDPAHSPLPQEIPSGVWNVLVTLKSKIASAIQEDFLLIELAQSLFEKHKDNPRKKEHIRQTLHDMGRLLVVLKEKSIFSFEDAIKPHNFCKVVEAIKDIAGFDEESQNYKKTGLALKLARSLKKIATIVLTGFDGNERVMRETKEFLNYCATEWNKLTSQKLIVSFSEQKVNNPSTIPFIRDVQVFYRYLETTSASAIESLTMHENSQAYSALCKVILAQASVLNKCAPEVSKMTLKAFQGRDNTTQVLSKHFVRINIPSRTGQDVAVLLTSALVSAMTLLLSRREACGVHQDNPYLFAKPNLSSISIYHGGNCIRHFSNSCCAKKPEHLRRVHLHKHIARIFQILNLENDELDHLAKLLGQDIRADREYYQAPEAAMELAKIAKLLLAMEEGSLEKFKGNSLEEIEVEDELESDVEQDSTENSKAEMDNESESHLPLQQSDTVEQQATMEKHSSQPTPEKDAHDHIKARRDKPFLEKRFIDPVKGSGVFTRESIEPSTFVVEYRGNISQKKNNKKKCDTAKNHLFVFSWNGTNWCIDASEEDGSLGKLVNDDHISPNCKMKKIVCEGKPHLCLFAVREISPGEEITYNYGDASYPRRSTVSNEKPNTSQKDTKAAASSPEHESVDDSTEAISSAESGSDDEYVPDGEPSSDDHSNSDNDQLYQDVKKKMGSSKQQSFLRRPVDASHVQEGEADDSSDFLTSDEDAEALTKRNYCYVCGNAKTKISRHLFTHRKQEPEIAEVFALPPSSKERSRLLDELRKRGNLKHNQEVLKTGSGELKVTLKAKTFAHCVYCKRMYRRKEMWLHMKKCHSQKSSTPSKRSRSKVLTLITAAESTDLTEMSADVSELLETLRKDEIASVVLNDPHILQVAQWCCRINKSRKSQTNKGIIERLKLMGRLLLVLKTKSICSFEEAIKPQNFSTLVDAVREIIGFNEEMRSYHKITLMMKLANSLQKIGYITYAKALKEGADKPTLREAETFLKLCEKEWSHSPTSTVNNIQFIHDVQVFHQCLEKTAASALESLSMYGSHQVYTALLRVTTAHVSVLNQKTADVSRVTLASFNGRNKTECLEDASVSLSRFEQLLSKHFVKIDVLNNKGKKVAVTLTPKLLTAVTLLASKRETCGVHKNNPFLFARPDDKCTSICQGQTSINIFMNRCGVKNAASLKSSSFHKRVVRVFLILSLTNEELDELAKLLGLSIRTDREYYQTPEAAADIAKISELLSAVENGTLERFEGKSLEEIEIADELEPDVEQEDTNNGDSVQNKESEKSLLLADLFSGMEAGFSSTPSKTRVSSSRKRGRGSSRKEPSGNEAPELNDEEQDNESEEMPESRHVNKLQRPQSHNNDDVTKMSFSDDDEDMNVDFDIDTDEDDVINRENDGDCDTNGPTTIPLIPDVQDRTKEDKHCSHAKQADSLPCSHSTGADYEDTMDIGADYEDTMETDEENHVGKEDPVEEGEQSKWMDVDSRSSSLKTEKKNQLSAALTGMKEVKICLTKLDIDKLQTPVHISQLPSVCNSVKWPAKDQPSHDDNNQCPTSSCPSTDMKNTPGPAKMTCSHCKKKMMKGQTAFQKKGFPDVFCSKTCLFALFPINKSAAKACHYCHKEILQPLDLIMAAVDMKGTMKDFCSVICLTAFKSNVVSPKPPQSTCSMCKTSCTASCEVTLNDSLHKFCSASCLEDFCRDNMAVCYNCSSTCFKKPLKLKLEEETKTICSDKCLKNFKENIKTSHQCTVCLISQPVSDMVHYNTSEDMVELFCTQCCAISHKQWPQTKENTLYQPTTKRRDTQLTENLISEDGNIKNDADLDIPTFTSSVLNTVCRHCEKEVKSGETLCRAKNSKDVFCSASCLSERQPHLKAVFKKCYNCFQVIMRPTKIILAPVDDSGTMRELCSDACLSSVKSKRNMVPPKPPPPAGPRTACTMCNRFGVCKFKVNLDGLMYRICSDDCYKNYHKVNSLPIFMCDICSSICLEKHLILKMEDNSKTICTEECLVKYKEKIETPQLCPMCQTTHQMSDMVEDKNEEGRLDFFCSNRCLLVYKAQSLTVSEPKSPTFDNNDIKEVKPSLLKLIKEEPIDEEHNQNVSPSISMKEIKDEPKVDKEDLKIGSVFSLTDSTSSSPTLTRDLPASCSGCKKALIDGETVYQRKGHAGIFCSTSCLLTFYQTKQAKKTCHFCLQVITQPQDVLQASVDTEETMKDFCSQSCLSSFNYKSVMATKIPITPLKAHSQCSMCSRYCISKHEILQQNVVHKICSEPCFLRFCNMNNLSICDNCHSHCSSPVMLKTKDSSKKLCSAECMAQFKQKIIALQPCTLCSTLCLMPHMIENRSSEDVVELFCSSSCVMASKIHAVCALGVPVNCDNCGKATVPACHLAMSDNSIRNFCSLTCAMNMKETQTATNRSAASDQTQSDLLKTPERLPCAQCRHILSAAPKVVQEKDKINFVCSLACSEEYKRVNNIMGKCEYCKNERIINDTKRVNHKDCYFCSDGCNVLFNHELERRWGEYCQSCAYCHSISETVVAGKHKGKQEKFCSEECSSKYKMLLRHAVKCDTCGRKGKLSQSLAMLGEVKHFCDLKCLLHFCNKKVETVPSPPRPAGTVESFPVISNVISLASALARQSSTSDSSAQHVSVPDVPTKVVGHASVQTVPKELKNKSMLCTPLVHNKGVSCTTQTMDTEAQTDNFVPKVLPVPVPVFVPVPMNMYSQYTPKPLCFPLPLPVPVFIPVTPGDPDLPAKSVTGRIQPEKTDPKSEMKKTADEKKEDGVVTNDEHDGQDSHAPNEHNRKCDDARHIDQQSTFNKEDSFSDTSVHSLGQPHTQEKPSPVSDVVMLSRRQPELPPSARPALDMRRDPQSSVSPEPAPPPLQQTKRKDHNKSKAQKLQEGLKDAKKETCQRELSTAKSRKHRKLKSHYGIDAWKRWIQWRESQTNLYLVSTHASMLNEDVLLCSTSELSDGLCRFITEVKQPDGSSYSPDGVFYLCLSIQKYLFDNGRLENIFSDRIYNRFCEEITRILKGFKPSVTASGYIHSRIEEEFLWDCKQLGAFSPIVLLNTLNFLCCKYFGFTTMEQHRQLSFAHVVHYTKTNQDHSKTNFLRFYPPLSTNNANADTDGIPTKKRKRGDSKDIKEMRENTENPLRCPVRLYEFYLSKCPESVKQSTDLFYLRPDRSCVPNSPVWFSSTPLDHSTIEAMLIRILTVREVHGEMGEV